MPKQRRKTASKQDIAASKAAQATREAARAQIAGRRNFMATLRNIAIAVPVITVAGYFTVQTVQAGIAEGDLTRIGQGIPAIVQIHDPQCGDCQVLQQQTRSILSDYDDADVTYLVANLTVPEGAAFAARHNVTHVTLLLFDAAGVPVQVVRGPITSEALRDRLDAHITQNAS